MNILEFLTLTLKVALLRSVLFIVAQCHTTQQCCNAVILVGNCLPDISQQVGTFHFLQQFRKISKYFKFYYRNKAFSDTVKIPVWPLTGLQVWNRLNLGDCQSSESDWLISYTIWRARLVSELYDNKMAPSIKRLSNRM